MSLCSLYSNTVSRSATFCAIMTTIERCKTEGVVDVFQVVKAMRVQKPGAIQTIVCYEHTIYEVICLMIFMIAGAVSINL